MAAKVVTLCGDLVTYLNGLTLSQAFTAERFDAWLEDVADSDAYRIIVVPQDTETTVETRTATQRRFRINVIVQKRLLSGDDLADTDACLLLAEEIEDALYGRAMGNFGFSEFNETAGSRSFVELEALASDRVFRTVVQVSYLGT